MLQPFSCVGEPFFIIYFITRLASYCMWVDKGCILRRLMTSEISWLFIPKNPKGKFWILSLWEYHDEVLFDQLLGCNNNSPWWTRSCDSWIYGIVNRFLTNLTFSHLVLLSFKLLACFVPDRLEFSDQLWGIGNKMWDGLQTVFLWMRENCSRIYVSARNANY